MWVGVLGPLEVCADGHDVDVAGPIPRRLLALLAARLGRFVSVDGLIDGVWGDDPPAAARATLQSHIARLRRSLGDFGAVAAGPAGYRLAVAAADIDAFSFAADIPAAPAGPGADQRTVARCPTRAPGGTAAGPAASPER